MKFRELRKKIMYRGRVAIKWNKSGIVEVAQVGPSGAIVVVNVVSKKVYTLPRRYRDIDVTILEPTALVPAGDLLPKEMR